MWDSNSSTMHVAFIGTGVICLTLLWYLRTTRRPPSSSTRARFETFLIEDASPPKRQPSNFNSFLGDASSSPSDEKRQKKGMEPVPMNAICIPIIYGTEFGLSKEVAEVLADRIKDSGVYWPIVLNMADCPKGVDLSKEKIAIFVCSTQGDGVPPYEARSFCEWLFDGESVGDLSALHFSVCALGDKSYTHFCRCGEQIRAALQRQGAQEATCFVTVDRENWTVIDQWISAVLSALPSLDLSHGRSNLADSVAVSDEDDRLWTKHRPFLARVTKRWNLCRVSDDNDKITMHLELDIADSGLSYLPGDAVGIYPSNRPSDVDEIMEALKIDRDVQISVPSWAPKLAGENGEEVVSLRNALLRLYDLRTPKTKLFTLIQQHLRSGKGEMMHSGHTVGPKLKGNGGLHDSGQSICDLQHATEQQAPPFLESIVQDMEKRELYLQSRHVIDILQEFPTSPLPLKQFLDSLRPLQPRLYSISSSYLHSSSSISITVAEVKYKARHRERVGVASTYLTERLQIGDSVPIYITVNPDFRLPASLTTPTLMIGPGTGLAPFRSFIMEKLAMAQNDAVGVNLLFFGCRRRDQDYLYAETLEDWNERGIIQLHTAFSREQEKKIYVQDLLWENKEAVWKLLKDEGHIYVCGDAQFMAPDVENCLRRIIQTHGSVNAKDAAKYLDTLAASRKYQRDVWF